MGPTMKTYEFKDFPNPRRVRIFLAEKGIEGIAFEQVDVPAGAHRRAPFLAKNPYDSVPVLELDDGGTIADEAFSIADITALCSVDYGRFAAIEMPGGLADLKRWHDAVSGRPSAGA